MAMKPGDETNKPLFSWGFKNGYVQVLDDVKLSVITYCCPCLTAGQNAGKVDRNCVVFGCLSMLPCCGPYFKALVRKDVQKKAGINEGTFMEALCFHCGSSCCALVQEARELE
mmetsp:Transcript_64397/g.139234  ORF Transcript_64397/g.139234 Transcript_64397/m.139234 type:complete len:113 (+) Transcript_64397:54-392(+)|eukprot:CAMPEP_0116946800 /NCGR_PEP_ID=MMETSP0467-20121206/37233_1 /TAXON_ID=283647 /ORGANISM="Mesodinium pulex, Strain SPMC105" /LENGTH=112 /DNA_ID=CAMNT_0004630711 /DNA_START=46 /DNA_END=384 /DNA_ORIENTATION=-